MVDDSLSINEATEVLQKILSEADMLDENGNLKEEYERIIDILNSISYEHPMP